MPNHSTCDLRSDSEVRCMRCGRSQQVSFAQCLASGWPKCCGATMRLSGLPSPDKIEASVTEVLGPATHVRRIFGGSL